MSVYGSSGYIKAQARYRSTERAKELAQERNRRYRESENGRELLAAYRKTDKFKEMRRRWRVSPVGKAYESNRRHQRRAAVATIVTAAEWEMIKANYDYKCVYCGKGGIKLTQDHVIPLSRGGSHTKENVVPACGLCNSSKGARLIGVC